eukprot:Opistho-2@89989
MVVLRLARFGRRHLPFYRIFATNPRGKRDGKHIEVVGTYNPVVNQQNQKTLDLKVDRIKYWLSVGAQPTEVVGRLLAMAGLAPMPPAIVAKRVHKKVADGVWEQYREVVAKASPPPKKAEDVSNTQT